jgi:pyruvate dehydrogenase E2 component (dihydrolipoamide acetyltransferase)
MAQLTVMAEVDMSAPRDLRERLNRNAAPGARVTYTDIVVKLAPLALKSHAVLNATLRGEELFLLGEYHIGVAVEIEDGLIVPVIRDVDRKSLVAVSRELAELTERARARRLDAAAVTGGTFTVTNAGMLGVDAVTPIVNPPEVAILGVGRIAARVLAVEGRAEVRPAATLCLSFDHRVVDGAPASRFMAEMRRLLEAPEAALAGQIE